MSYSQTRRSFPSHNTDGPGNPLSRAYTTDRIRRAFSAFAEVETRVRMLNLCAYPLGERLERRAWVRALGRRLGWQLWISARRA
jgi:hypothetical protein